jgi:serine-type D-Ala-D-Ala carboxypeptidase/endopeptidase
MNNRFPPFGWLLAFAVAWANAFPPKGVCQEDLRPQISILVQPYLEAEMVVGGSIGWIKGQQSDWMGFGRLSLQEPASPAAQTIYEIGSITKVFTGILLADAVVQERLDLDQAFVAAVDPAYPVPHSTQSKITWRHLATHTSGLPRMPDNFRSKIPEDPYVDYTPADLFQYLHQHELMANPGDRWQYSNLGFGLLGQLIADQSNAAYEQVLVERLLKPLGMEDTALQLNADQQRRLATPHDADGQPVHPWHFQAMAGAGAIRSNIQDMLTFASSQLTPPPNDLGKAIDLAWKIHQESLGDGSFATGLGWLVAKDGNTRFHNGQTGGFHSAVFLNRQLNQAVVILANSATGEIDLLAEDLFRLLAGQEVKPRDFPKPVPVSADSMQRLAGKYQLIPGLVFSVDVVDGKLMVGLTGQPSLRVYPQTETTWKYRAVDATITFELDEEGNCTELVLFQNGIRQRARKIP